MHMEFMFMHMGVVMALALFGNGFLVFVICHGNRIARQKISPVQLLLLHTCVADILFALLSLGTEMMILSVYPYFYAPEFVCKTVRYLQAMPLYASPFLLVAISVDRFQAICRPLVNYRSDRYRRPNCLGFTAWFLALLCSLPQLFIWHKPDKFYFTKDSFNISSIYESILPSDDECRTVYGRESNPLKSAYIVWFASMAWLLPSLISAVFYYKVVKTVWKSKCSLNQILNSTVNTGTSPTVTHKTTQNIFEKKRIESTISCLTREYVVNLRKRSSGMRNQVSEFDRKRIQTVRLTLTIIACNFFLWAPFCIMNVVQAFTPNLLNPKIITYIVILGNLNSCVNPWIYIFFNRRMATRALTSMIITSAKVRSSTSASSIPSNNTRQTSVILRPIIRNNHNNHNYHHVKSEDAQINEKQTAWKCPKKSRNNSWKESRRFNEF